VDIINFNKYRVEKNEPPPPPPPPHTNYTPKKKNKYSSHISPSTSPINQKQHILHKQII